MSQPTVTLPSWMFDHPNEFFLVAIEPSGKAHIDGGHSEHDGVAKARELFQRIEVIRPPEGTRYVMVGIAEVPAFRGALNEDAIRQLNRPSVTLRRRVPASEGNE